MLPPHTGTTLPSEGPALATSCFRLSDMASDSCSAAEPSRGFTSLLWRPHLLHALRRTQFQLPQPTHGQSPAFGSIPAGGVGIGRPTFGSIPGGGIDNGLKDVCDCCGS